MSVDAADTERLLDDYAIDLSDLSEDASEHSCSAECSVKAADGGCCCGSVPVVEKVSEGRVWLCVGYDAITREQVSIVCVQYCALCECLSNPNARCEHSTVCVRVWE